MSISFDASLTPEQLTKILRDGFGQSLVDSLVQDLVNKFKADAAQQLKQSEALIKSKLTEVVDHYMLRSTGFNRDVATGNLVVNILIEKREVTNVN